MPRLRLTAASKLALGFALVATAALASPSTRDAFAHGALDQQLGNDIGTCDSFSYPAFVSAAGGQAQEFVPSQPGIAAVELCMHADLGPTNVTVRIRGGSAGAPGAVIGGANVVVAAQPGWQHVDFAAPVVVTPGETYVIELATDGGLQIAWLGNPHDTEYYAAGESNAPDVVRDFAFRTYASPVEDTPVPSATRTGTPTKTRTPSPTRTPSQTPTPAPTGTPSPLSSSATPPPPEPSAVGAGATPPPSGPPATTPTRTSAVLGGARRTGAIRLPDVGTGPAQSNRRTVAALAITLLAAATLALAASRLRHLG